MKKVKLSSFFLFISGFIFILSISISSSVTFAQGEDEGLPSCWTCKSEDPNKCFAATSCGMTACNDNEGVCFPFGAICSVIPNGCA